MALATTLSGFVAAAFHYLLKYIEKLEEALEKANTSTAATNEVNATLAKLWIQEQQKRSGPDSS